MKLLLVVNPLFIIQEGHFTQSVAYLKFTFKLNSRTYSRRASAELNKVINMSEALFYSPPLHLIFTISGHFILGFSLCVITPDQQNVRFQRWKSRFIR
jgi:hypothetical protein